MKNESNMMAVLSQELTSGSFGTNYNDWSKALNHYHWYPTYTTYWHEEPNKTEQAFRVIQKLIELKLVKMTSVEKFVKTVTEVAKIL